MFDLTVSLNISGKNFSPSHHEKSLGVLFAEKNEPGDIGVFGRYKGKPIPFGSATIMCHGKTNETIISVIEQIEGKLDKFRKAGADMMVMHLAINYSEQCNLEFSPSLLNKISKLKIPLTITCVNTGDDE